MPLEQIELLELMEQTSGETGAAETSTGQQTLALVSIDPGTIGFTLLNTLILVLAYYFLLHKKVCAMLDKRRGEINSEMDAAAAAEKRAKEAEEQYNAELAENKAKAAEIMQQAVARATAKEEEIVAGANAEALNIKKKAEESVEKEKKRAMNEMKNQLTELVVMAAGKVAEKEISAEDNEELISGFLKNASVNK